MLWQALSDWLTPEAVAWVNGLEKEYFVQQQQQQNDENANNKETSNIAAAVVVSSSSDWAPQVDRSDIGASRCAGLMAMIKLYLPTAMKELKRSEDLRRIAERRLADLLRCFDYSMPTAN